MAKKKRNNFIFPGNNFLFNDSAYGNAQTYNFLCWRMSCIYMDRIRYKNLPDSIDLPALTWGLLANGSVCYFNDMVMGDLCLQGSPSGRMDIYNYPVKYYIHTSSGYTRTLNVSMFSSRYNGVVIYDNFLRTAPLRGIYYYADKLFNALRAADVNIKTQQKPRIIKTSQDMRLSVENMLTKVDGYQHSVVVDKGMSEDTILNIDLTTPYVADKLWTYVTNIWNDFLTWCGIENATNQKRERLVSDEVNANYGDVEMERSSSLDCQRQSFDRVNRLFGTNIEIEFNSDLQSGLNAPFNIMNSEKNEEV